MSSRGTKARACTGKRVHQRRCDATVHLRYLVSSGAHRSRLSVYHCRHCKAWHVGHKNEDVRHQ